MVKKAKDAEQKVDLREIFLGLQKEMSAKLSSARKVIRHAPTKGDVSENSWLGMLNKYLPKRYTAQQAIIIDSDGNLSDAIDIVIFDQHFAPFMFNHEGALYIPAESVYAAFEVKQEVNAKELKYAAGKAASIRRLKRVSASIPHAGGIFPALKPKEIIFGVLALRSKPFETNPAKFTSALLKADPQERLNIGCFLDSGSYALEGTQRGTLVSKTFERDVALIGFFLSVLHMLQQLGTAPAMDVPAYRKNL